MIGVYKWGWGDGSENIAFWGWDESLTIFDASAATLVRSDLKTGSVLTQVAAHAVINKVLFSVSAVDFKAKISSTGASCKTAIEGNGSRSVRWSCCDVLESTGWFPHAVSEGILPMKTERSETGAKMSVKGENAKVVKR
ncbi:MAG: hypothetical protein HY889_00425 [Deltaproteobacteria bacterium]|nr:hypothetical protein [Deltaproteobacteria bacterium]